jgi:protein involved in sex pheromone biosynthesis
MRKKTIIGLIAALLLLAGAMQCIRSNNDHLECEQRIGRHQDSNGNIVTEERHVCKEKFNF